MLILCNLQTPEGKTTFSDLSKKELVQCLGDASASLLLLLGIDTKSLAIKDNLDAGKVVESYLSIREKLALDTTTKGVLQAAMPGSSEENANRVINLGQILEVQIRLLSQAIRNSKEVIIHRHLLLVLWDISIDPS